MNFKTKLHINLKFSLLVSFLVHSGIFFILFHFFSSYVSQDKKTSFVLKLTPNIEENVIDEAIELSDLNLELEENISPPENLPEIAPELQDNEANDLNFIQLKLFNKNSSIITTRSQQGKVNLIAKGGGSPKVLSSIDSALTWLQKNQNADGSWGNRFQNANTAISTLLFLAHGKNTASSNYGTTIQKSLKWMSKRLLHEENKLSDVASEIDYGYAIMVYALAEAYQITNINELKLAMEKGVYKILSGYQSHGGFEYKFLKTGIYDLSYSTWCFQALRAAYYAKSSRSERIRTIFEDARLKLIKNLGLKLNDSEKVNSFYYIRNAKGDLFESYIYKFTPIANPYQRTSTMRAVGALTLQILGENKKVAPVASLIANEDYKSLTWTTPTPWPIYSWYYATQVMFNNKRNNQIAWKKWNNRFQKVLLDNQNPKGYWESPMSHEKREHQLVGIDGKIYDTALAGLTLSVYYRYLPSSRLIKHKKLTTPPSHDSVEVELDFLN